MKFIDPQEAFEAAIQLGLLCKDATARNYVGNFMYMGTDEHRGHAFKHIDTRSYHYTGD